jgi:hypothetical protein
MKIKTNKINRFLFTGINIYLNEFFSNIVYSFFPLPQPLPVLAENIDQPSPRGGENI